MCDDDEDATCNEISSIDTFFSTSYTTTTGYGGVVGIAKDGHVIYGPYNEDGELWACGDVDLCNGFTLDDGSYGYASTGFYPFTVGCWGPAPNAQTHALSCSSTSCTGSTAAGLVVSNVLIVIAIAVNCLF